MNTTRQQKTTSTKNKLKRKKMKTSAVNGFVIVTMLISLLAFYQKWLPADTNPKIVLWIGGIGAGFSLALKLWWSSGTWNSSIWKGSFWIFNILSFVALLLPIWGDMGLVGASFVTATVGTINIILTGLGVTQNTGAGVSPDGVSV